uniref:C-type lectin domain-containing protein n=1 Tax=Neolamprologus brichardi TaxID=32507 RepID=A0A3Q4H920_NEOBR
MFSPCLRGFPPVLLCLMFGWCTCTGYVTLCSPTHREFYLINGAKIWADAQSYCRRNYTNLATIGSQDDMQRLVNMVSASGVTAEMWIGLTQTGPAAWLWSVGETQISDGVVEYSNWASLPSSTDNCGGMRDDGKWFSAPCTTTLPYVCQGQCIHGKDHSKYTQLLFHINANKINYFTM